MLEAGSLQRASTRSVLYCVIETRLMNVPSGPQEGLGCRWSRADIAMELGGVLKARDAMHLSPNAPPASHRLFSNLVFKYGTDAVGGTQQLGEGDVDEEPVQERRERGDWSDMAKPGGGWLDSDDIEDF
jgi:cell cycle checkpoint protein